MNIYIKIFWFNLRKYFDFYPFEFLADILRRAIGIGYILLFWIAVGKSIDITLLSYFIFATFVNEFVAADFDFSSVLEKAISSGEINNILIKPINPIWYYLSEKFAKYGAFLTIQLLLAVVFMLLSNVQFANFMLFIPVLIISFTISLSFNILLASLAFYLTIVKNLRNMFSHIFRLATGLFIPISFFPEYIQNFLMLTPLPYIISLPSLTLQNSLDQELFGQILIALIYAIILIIIALLVWNKSLKNYEAFGI